MDILRTYRAKTRNEDIQTALLRTLGKLGSPEAIKDITEALKNSSNKLRMAGTIAAGEWPTAKPIAELQGLLKDEKDRGIRVSAFNGMGRLAPLSGTIPQEELTKYLKAAYDGTKDNLELTAIVGAIKNVTEPGAATLLQEIANKDPDRRRKDVASSGVRPMNVALGKVVMLTGNDTLPPAGATDRQPAMILDPATGAVANWTKSDDQIGWLVKVDKAGEYDVKVSLGYTGTTPGRYAVTLWGYLHLETGGEDVFRHRLQGCVGRQRQI